MTLSNSLFFSQAHLAGILWMLDHIETLLVRVIIIIIIIIKLLIFKIYYINFIIIIFQENFHQRLETGRL